MDFKDMIRRRLPDDLLRHLHHSRQRAHRLRHPAAWGTLRRRTAFSTYGYERGTPIDRVFIERVLDRWAEDIRGQVLEVKDATYTHRFGGDAVTTAHVLDIRADNPRATIVGDLGVAGALPVSAFDCIILTQTLQYVAEMEVAVRSLHDALRPGGVLLVTVPAVARLDRTQVGAFDGWRLTPDGLRHLLGRCFEDVTAGSDGNLTAAVAFMLGVAAEELRPSELGIPDPEYPVIVWARVRRPR